MLRIAFAMCLSAPGLCAAEIDLPLRQTNAAPGSEFIAQIKDMDRKTRESAVREQFDAGNMPDFWRHFASVVAEASIGDRQRRLEYFVAPEYLAVGSDADYFLAPLSPESAQAICDKYGRLLPTPKMVDQIYAAAAVKLDPSPIPPSPAMTTVPVFAQHNATVRVQRVEKEQPLGALTAGHKKDVVITARLTNSPGKVAIYGWHHLDATPIQPLYLGHGSVWVDYSHGIRLVLGKALLDGKPVKLDMILADPELSALVSYEGPVAQPRYGPPLEVFSEIKLDRGIRVAISAPGALETNKPVRLILYALPNGNTIEQTIGRKPARGDDYRFDIQHIGAQTRWLRENTHDANLVVAYIECAEKSWPGWKRKNTPQPIPEIVDAVKKQFNGHDVKLVLNGHSGGGSFVFGYIDNFEKIPDDVERIAFLDSEYGYDADKSHDKKLAQWLMASDRHFLGVFAYHDSVALLDGKTFVSEESGTWGRSHAMLKDLKASFAFETMTQGDMEFDRALDGRMQFFLRENPAKAILHTTQVELNGFIHSLLLGTAEESKGYAYFGPRAYSVWIQE